MVALLCAFLALPLATASASVPSAALAVPVADGAAKPTPGSGIATKAALTNPKCKTGATYGPYGQFDGAIVGGGAVCTRPFKAGENNGGATSPGVTKDKISVVYVLGNVPETRAQPAMNTQTGAMGTDEDAAHDLLLAMRPYYETWGREIDVKFYTSTGTDETAQRADAVAIKAMKPFAVVNSYNAGYGTMAIELAKAKILVYDAETGKEDFTALAPYLWGSTDSQVAAINTAEVLGKQMVGKKAEYAGNDVKGQPRKFGVVTKEGDVDVPGFKKELAKYKGTVTSEATYPPTGGTYGDATLANQFAPTIVTKMKADGVTTMVLFTDAAMNKAMMEQATKQEWFPEWFHTGNSYADYSAFAKTLPPEQATHFFGISGSSPYLTQPIDPDTATKGMRGEHARLVLGAEELHVDGQARQRHHLAAAGHPRRRSRPHSRDVPAGPVLGARTGRIGEQLAVRGAARVREDDGSAVRRVQPGAGRLPAVLDGARRGGAERDRDGREAVVMVREQRAAVPGRHVSDQEGGVVRQSEVGRRIRHAPPAAEGAGPHCM